MSKKVICASTGKKKAKVLEVIGPNGDKIAEYVDTPDKPRREYILEERCQL